jgi:hypothetical protein
MDRTLTSFIWVWVSLIILINVFGIAGILASADTSWQALQKVAEIYSPANVILELLVLSPAIGAYIWREWRRNSLHSR